MQIIIGRINTYRPSGPFWHSEVPGRRWQEDCPTQRRMLMEGTLTLASWRKSQQSAQGYTFVCLLAWHLEIKAWRGMGICLSGYDERQLEGRVVCWRLTCLLTEQHRAFIISGVTAVLSHVLKVWLGRRKIAIPGVVLDLSSGHKDPAHSFLKDGVYRFVKADYLGVEDLFLAWQCCLK